jgi:hypothetical protein
MPSIALMTTHANFPWFRQIPGGGDCIGEWRFTLNTIEPDCELVVVYDEPLDAFECPLPASRRVLITSEPPGMKRYHAGFANQFGHLMGPVDVPGFMGKMHQMHSALPWFYAVKFENKICTASLDFTALANVPIPKKQEAISVVISKKAKLPKHRARLRFIEALEKRLGSHLHIFGRGFNEISDKAEAIYPYAYHLVLENNDIPHFWTEKTADAYLGWALPIFSGCPNLGDYFPVNSFVAIDILQQAEALDRVEATLQSKIWAQSLPELSAAREKLMMQHNLFVVLVKFMQKIVTDPLEYGRLSDSSSILKPNSAFFAFNGLKTVAKKVKKLLLVPKYSRG